MRQNNGRSFVVMAKPVGSRCNMRCTYCYYLDKGRYSNRIKQNRMGFGLLEKLIRQTIESCQGPVASFTWHGGEPTLAGIDFYKKVVELERKYLPQGWQVWNNLQTNGLMLNDTWCKFLKENCFDVGISIDGSQTVHDKNRRDLGGNNTYCKVQKSVKRLCAAGIEPDILCTVNAASVADPLGVYRALRELHTGWIQFIPIIMRLPDGSLSPESIAPEEYGEFLCKVFDEWIAHDLGRLDVQFFAEIARILAGGKASACWMSPTCGRVLIVEMDGSVYSCDHFVDAAHRLGNLNAIRLGVMADSEFQTYFGNAKQVVLTEECRRCQWLRFCNGGCMKDRFGLSESAEVGQYYLCRGLKVFFAHAVPMLERLIEMSKMGMNSDEIMSTLCFEKQSST